MRPYSGATQRGVAELETPTLGPEWTPESPQCPLPSPTKGVLSVFSMPATWDSVMPSTRYPFPLSSLGGCYGSGRLGPSLPCLGGTRSHTRLAAVRRLGPVCSSWPGLWLHRALCSTQAPQRPPPGPGAELLTRGKASLPSALGLQ